MFCIHSLVSYPIGTNTNAISSKLQSAIAAGAVTNSLISYGFSKASANTVIIALGTPVPSPAPTIISPGKIAAATVCSFVGFVGLVVFCWYTCYMGCRCCSCCYPPTIEDPSMMAIQPEPETMKYLPYDNDMEYVEEYDDRSYYAMRGPENTV